MTRVRTRADVESPTEDAQESSRDHTSSGMPSGRRLRGSDTVTPGIGRHWPPVGRDRYLSHT